MPRYILIDNASGFIFGDTADYNGKIAIAQTEGGSPIDAARELDETVVGEHGRSYAEVGRRELASNETGYHVYRADINGSDAVATIADGQDPEMIEAVERDCKYVTTVRCTSAE